MHEWEYADEMVYFHILYIRIEHIIDIIYNFAV